MIADYGMRFLRVIVLLLPGCSLFEPRDPEQPSQSGLNLPPPTTPEIVISNLQSSIANPNLQNYINCFSNPSTNPRGFTFVPSPSAVARYGTVLSSWTYDKEYVFMQTLIPKAPTSGFSGLQLTLRTSLIFSDSVDFTYDYVFDFETKPENNFPRTARGSLEFKIGVDSRGWWSIYYWRDNDVPQSTDNTWSAFKGKFGS